MRAAALALLRLTTFILPIFRCQEDDVHASDHYRMAGLNRLRGVHEVAPNDVPAGMIVVGLDRPRPRAAFGLQGLLWRRIEPAMQ